MLTHAVACFREAFWLLFASDGESAFRSQHLSGAIPRPSCGGGTVVQDHLPENWRQGGNRQVLSIWYWGVGRRRAEVVRRRARTEDGSKGKGMGGSSRLSA